MWKYISEVVHKLKPSKVEIKKLWDSSRFNITDPHTDQVISVTVNGRSVTINKMTYYEGRPLGSKTLIFKYEVFRAISEEIERQMSRFEDNEIQRGSE